MARSAAGLSMVPRIARFAGVSGLVLGLAGALATPAAAAGPPGPGGPVSHQPGLVPRQPGLALPRGLAQPGFPGGLWRPGATGSGTWRPALTPAASTGAPAEGPLAAPPGGPTAAPAGGPAAASSSWRAQQTPNPVIRNGVLDAISCASPGTCLAVGGYENRAGAGLPLAEARTSTGWRVQPAPAPPGAVFSNLFGVSCTAADACTAAGYYTDGLRHIHPLAERWDGRSWRIQAAPSPLGRPLSGFFAVSCTSATACTAVGAQTDATGTTALAPGGGRGGGAAKGGAPGPPPPPRGPPWPSSSPCPAPRRTRVPRAGPASTTPARVCRWPSGGTGQAGASRSRPPRPDRSAPGSPGCRAARRPSASPREATAPAAGPRGEWRGRGRGRPA